MHLKDELIKASDPDIGAALSQTYSEIVEHYVFRRWKSAGLDAGHFVEAARRLLELKLLGAATPIRKPLSNFNEKVLKEYADAKGDEGYRILIPRLLWGLYALRNKRVGHLSAVPASEIDITLLLNGAKWVLAEIIRIESRLNPDDVSDLISDIITKQIPIVWKTNYVTRVLDVKIKPREKVLILLSTLGDMLEDDLRAAVCYKDPRNFRKILIRLEESNFVASVNGLYKVSPLGVALAEKIVGESLPVGM